MIVENSKLDNPVWHSLSETHKELAIEFDGAKFYDPACCPFGGFNNIEKTVHALRRYSDQASIFFVVGHQPKFSNPLILNKELVCNQMVLDSIIETDDNGEIVELNAEHKNDLLDLVNLVQPGYFKNKTPELGNYYGIYAGNQLLAVAGERMKMNNYTEVSAVVTHPDHTGRGLAKKLVAHASNSILLENKTPYLHVAEENIGAVKLYEKLGFVTRRKISFWNFIKKE
jgi:ribosomal protein S18 acetylase RimI-like enzyme